MIDDLKLTIFTPTYNRSGTLTKLYNSLISQTCQKFVWLVIDDGSTDGTDKLIDGWKKEKKIIIEYYYQNNSGKSMAYNVAIEKTYTELFTCVDSDDYLAPETIQEIIDFWKEHKKYAIGIVARREVTILKKHFTNELVKSSLDKMKKKHGICGDTMLIYDTEIIKKYKFPSFEGEKFVPEKYLYDKYDKEGELVFLNKVVYFGSYLKDGYTKNMAKILKENPNGYFAYIEQRLDMDDTIIDYCADTIRYIAMRIACKKEKLITKSKNPIASLLLLPFGYLFYCIRYRNI